MSHETIYRTLFVQARGALKKGLLAHLRSGRRMRKARRASTAGQQRGQIKDAVSIRERPAEAEVRAVPGHWEGDLLAGARNTHIVATLVERSSRFVMLVRVRGKDTQSVVRGFERTDPTTTRGHDGHLELGPRHRDGRSQEVHGSHRRCGLLLRPEKPLVARHERKHQQAAAPVLAQRDGPLGTQPVRSGSDRAKTQQPTPQDSRLPHPG